MMQISSQVKLSLKIESALDGYKSSASSSSGTEVKVHATSSKRFRVSMLLFVCLFVCLFVFLLLLRVCVFFVVLHLHYSSFVVVAVLFFLCSLCLRLLQGQKSQNGSPKRHVSIPKTPCLASKLATNTSKLAINNPNRRVYDSMRGTSLRTYVLWSKFLSPCFRLCSLCCSLYET